jgi:putative hydrolase of the HAD superfamily
MPYARDVLQELSGRYPLHLITNGFHHVQIRKLRNTDLGHYFGQVITADKAGALKPSRQIFEHALNSVNAAPGDAIYIGDHLEADMLGAKNAGMDQVYFNPGNQHHHAKLTYEVRCLSELIALFP